jgi:transposase
VSEDYDNLSRLELVAIIEELRGIVQRQELRIAELERKLAGSRKNSSNSSKPPSSDIVKPHKPSRGKPSKRKRGGQPGHPMHERPPFDADQVSATQVHGLTTCPGCGGAVELTDNAPRILQKVELIAQTPWAVTEHQAHAYYCARCKCVHYAPMPAEVERGGMLGPKLMALIGYMKGVMHASFSTIRKYFRDVLKLPVSRSRLAKAVHQVSQSLKDVHDRLGDLLVKQATLRVDETGHKDNGRRHWTWCFRAQSFTWFHIAPTRSSQVLLDVLGEPFEGVLGCDYFSAYRKYMRECDVLVQFCLAHLIRDLKYLTTLPDAKTATYGRRLVEKVRQLFRLIHEGQTLPPATLTAQLRQASQRIIRSATTRVPASREARAIARRFQTHGPAYFQFITTPGIEPTNNLAEQALRFVVIDRHITQGTRSTKGQRWCERIWTVLATCVQQGRSAMDFIRQAVTAWVQGQPPPSLVPKLVPP